MAQANLRLAAGAVSWPHVFWSGGPARPSRSPIRAGSHSGAQRQRQQRVEQHQSRRRDGGRTGSDDSINSGTASAHEFRATTAVRRADRRIGVATQPARPNETVRVSDYSPGIGPQFAEPARNSDVRRRADARGAGQRHRTALAAAARPEPAPHDRHRRRGPINVAADLRRRRCTEPPGRPAGRHVRPTAGRADPLWGVAGLLLIPARRRHLGYRQARAAQAAAQLGRHPVDPCAGSSPTPTSGWRR